MQGDNPRRNERLQRMSFCTGTASHQLEVNKHIVAASFRCQKKQETARCCSRFVSNMACQAEWHEAALVRKKIIVKGDGERKTVQLLRILSFARLKAQLNSSATRRTRKALAAIPGCIWGRYVRYKSARRTSVAFTRNLCRLKLQSNVCPNCFDFSNMRAMFLPSHVCQIISAQRCLHSFHFDFIPWRMFARWKRDLEPRS